MSASKTTDGPTFLYDAFISYRHVERDRKWAEWLIAALESYRVPHALQAKGYPARLKKVFRDEDEMPASGDLNDQIKQALAASRFVIVICSPYTPRSKWVGREIEIFKDLGRGDQVLALLTEGEPHDSFPAALLERAVVVEKPDGTREIVKENTEPLAADVRPRKGVKDRALKQQALLRLVACILGVSYDTLRQRERERERQGWWQTAGAAAAVVLAAAGSGLGYWEYTRPKVAYYREMVLRWGLPEGLGLIDEETRRHRESSYRFVTRMGRVIEVRLENSAGVMRTLDDRGDDISRWAFSYTDDGNAARIDHFDQHNQLSHQETRRRDGNRMLLTYEQGEAPLAMAARVNLFADSRTESGPSTRSSSRSEITRQALVFDERGYTIERRYQDPWGTPRQNAENSYGERLSYTAEGLPVRRAKLGPDGAELIDRAGIAAVLFEYDGNRQVARRTFVGPEGRPITGPQSFAIIEYGYDRWGNVVAKAYRGEDGELRTNHDGYARIEITYDARGFEVARAHFGTQGAAVEHKGGCARLMHKFDDRGNYLERACFGANGLPALRISEGYHRWIDTYDEHNRPTSWAYVGTDGKPVMTRWGFARMDFGYDAAGNRTSEKYFGIDGKPMLKDGYATLILKYNDRRWRVEEAYFGLDGKPAIRHDLGGARVTFAYDTRGNLTEQAIFGTDGALVRSRGGWSRVRFSYDARGNMTEQEHLGVDGRPAADTFGIATYVWKADDRGNLVESVFRGPNGAPALGKAGCARLTQKLDERGKSTEGACFGVDGQPKLNAEMCASWRYTYDGRGNQASVSCFGIDAAPTLHKSGYARWTSAFNDRGNLLERAYFGTDGRPVASRENGAARLTNAFDPRGRRIETSFFGVDGKPIVSNAGYAIWKASYDARGNQISESFFGADGGPVMARIGMARVERVFDDRDRFVAVRFYDARGRQLEREVAVSAVAPDSQAAKLGIAIGDRLVAYDDRKIFAIVQVRNLPEQAGFGIPHTLTVRRGAETLTFPVEAGQLGITARLVAPDDRTPSPRAAAPATDAGDGTAGPQP